MPKRKPLHSFVLFCSICKEHIEIHAEDKKQAEGKFNAQGHEYIRVKTLLRGLPGVRLNENQVQAKYASQDRRKKRKKTVSMHEEVA